MTNDNRYPPHSLSDRQFRAIVATAKINPEQGHPPRCWQEAVDIKKNFMYTCFNTPGTAKRPDVYLIREF